MRKHCQKKFVPRLLNFLCVLFAAAHSAFAQSWTLTSAPVTNWGGVVSSADGSKISAIAESQKMYTSSNSGATWVTNNEPGGNFVPFSCIASSADGTRLVGGNNNSGEIATSADSGTTWVVRTNYVDCYWSSALSSTDGRTLVLCEEEAPIFFSTNWGANWSILAHLPYHGYGSYAALSADGTRLVVANNNTGIYTTTNLGGAWVTNNLALAWKAMASSADCRKLVAATTNSIYTSSDSGITWLKRTNSPSLAPWQSVASSADGARLVAAAGGYYAAGPIYTSTNSGVTWTSNNLPVQNWVSVASSADGNKLVAVVYNGGIWVSQSTPAPLLNITSSGTNLSLSWTVPSANFILRQKADLGAANWLTLTNVPTLNLSNLQNQVNLSPSNSNGFFRLAVP